MFAFFVVVCCGVCCWFAVELFTLVCWCLVSVLVGVCFGGCVS